VVVERSTDAKQMVVTALDPIKGKGPELTRYNVDFFSEEFGTPLFGVSPDGTRLAVA
jgi:hypothetical protein